MSGTWTKQGEEPTLETLFADPILDLLLRRDGLTVQDVWRAIDRARSCGIRSGKAQSCAASLAEALPACSSRIDEAA